MKIELKDVSKKIKDITLIDDVSVSFESGIIYGLVGRNGSGKSILLKLICSFYEPTKGQILFDQVDIVKEKIFPPNTRALIEKPSFLPNLTGFENLVLLSFIQKTISEEEIDIVLKKVDLYEERNKKYHQYSLGMKQKLGIAQVLMENPKVMIFDEPFNVLDEGSAQMIRKLLLEKKAEGKIIIIATHIHEDIDQLCDVLYHIENGKIIPML